MDKETKKNLFWLGTLFLYIGMMCLTILPKLALEKSFYSYINVGAYRAFGAVFFLLAFVVYLFQKDSFKGQLAAISISFAFLLLFNLVVI